MQSKKSTPSIGVILFCLGLVVGFLIGFLPAWKEKISLPYKLESPKTRFLPYQGDSSSQILKDLNSIEIIETNSQFNEIDEDLELLK